MDARLLNHTITIAELIDEVMHVTDDERRVFDTIMMLNCVVDGDDTNLRNHQYRNVLRFANSATWKDFWNAQINSNTNLKVEETFLKHFVHFGGGTLGPHVLVKEILSAIAYAIGARTRATRTSTILMSLNPTPKSKPGQSPTPKTIYGYIKSGEWEKVLDMMKVAELATELAPAFTVDGSPVNLDTLLSIPPSMSSEQLATTVHLLTELESMMEREYAHAVELNIAAEKVLSRDDKATGEMRQLMALGMETSGKAVKGLNILGARVMEQIRLGLGAEGDVASSVRTYMSEINQALINQSLANAIIQLLAHPDDVNLGLLSRVRKALESLQKTVVSSGTVLSTLGASEHVSPFAASFVREPFISLVEGMVREGLDAEFIELSLNRLINNTPLNLEQLALLLNVNPNLDDIAEALKVYLEQRLATVSYWEIPKLQPWLRAILLPNVDAGVVFELTQRLQRKIPNITVWVDTTGDGTSICCAFGIAHSVKKVDEVFSRNLARTALPLVMNDPAERAARTFVDRPIPPFLLDMMKKK